MKKLGKFQIAHFAKMTAVERKTAIRSFEAELDRLAVGQSSAAEEKRAELQARIAHLLKLGSG